MSDLAHKYWADPERYGVSAYLERPDRKVSGLDKALTRWAATLRTYATPRLSAPRELPAAVMALGETLVDVSDAGLLARATALRPRLLREGFVRHLLVEAFAITREATRRELGLAHRPVQIRGAQLLLQGALVEMATGEGKTITAMLAAATAALAGLRVHVITVNDYLAERDHAELGPIFKRLGLSTALIVNSVAPNERRGAYAADIVYVNNKEITFDYLRDRLSLGPRRSRARALIRSALGDPDSAAAVPELNLRGLDFAIVDEADSVLIDEARTPLIISAESARPDQPDEYQQALAIARQLEPDIDFEILARERQPRLLPEGRHRIGELSHDLGEAWTMRRAREERLGQALSALHVFVRDEHYIVVDDKVQIVDEFTGRVMPDRSWEAGLHQMIEVKEGVPLTGRRRTIARITYQRFFRRYRHLSGMTGTGLEVAGELEAEFDLRTVRVPTHRPIARRFLGVRLFADAPSKWARVVAATQAIEAAGRPVLIGVRSVEASETLSAALMAAGLSPVVLNARQDKEEADIIARAGLVGAITVATNMAGRGTDIKLGPGVAETGGLHVILTEFHESGRIDRQLYGRAGRQGDPGSCEAIVALDDDLFHRFAARITATLRTLPAGPGGALPSRWARGLRAFCQWRAEAMNASTRRHVLQNDKDTERQLAFAGRAE